MELVADAAGGLRHELTEAEVSVRAAAAATGSVSQPRAAMIVVVMLVRVRSLVVRNWTALASKFGSDDLRMTT